MSAWSAQPQMTMFCGPMREPMGRGALNGPLHDLSDYYLFSAHMVQHLLLTLVVLPLLLAGTPRWMADALVRCLERVRVLGALVRAATRPVPALTRIRGVLVQLVEIPGLIEGAHEDRGGGRALLGVLRGADAIVLCHDATAPLEELDVIKRELVAAGIDLPSLVVATKTDEAPAPPGTVGVSVLDDASLDRFRVEIWRLTGLMRVFVRRPGEEESEPLALHPPASVADVARTIHQELEQECTGARVWGDSAQFPGQRVGRTHAVADGDTIEVLVR